MKLRSKTTISEHFSDLEDPRVDRTKLHINPEKLQQCFLKWIQSISQLTDGEIVAIDGKTLGHSYDKSLDQAAIHMVSA